MNFWKVTKNQLEVQTFGKWINSSLPSGEANCTGSFTRGSLTAFQCLIWFYLLGCSFMLFNLTSRPIQDYISFHAFKLNTCGRPGEKYFYLNKVQCSNVLYLLFCFFSLHFLPQCQHIIPGQWILRTPCLHPAHQHGLPKDRPWIKVMALLHSRNS